MSKNFQLLRRVEKVDIFTVPGEPAQPQFETSAAILFKKATHDAEIAKLVQRLFSQASKGSVGPKVVSFSGIANEDRSSWICRRVGRLSSNTLTQPFALLKRTFGRPDCIYTQASIIATGLRRH